VSTNESDVDRGVVRPPTLTGDWLPANRAVGLLGCNGDGLLALGKAGRIDLVLVAGEMLVNAATVRAVAHERLDGAMAAATETAARWERLLAAYLDAHPVAFTLDDARRGRRPLVMRRRGNPATFRHADITRYQVAAHLDDLTAFALTRVGGELEYVPSRGAVATALLDLGGVEQRHWITPMFPADGPSVRVRGWIGIDPTIWRMQAPPDLSVLTAESFTTDEEDDASVLADIEAHTTGAEA
jgi:hypothetical protein